MDKRAALIGGSALLLLAAAGTAGWLGRTIYTPGDAVTASIAATLPIPPLPPRLPESERYDRCLAQVTDDPTRAAAEAEAWAQESGAVAARHCLALADLALGHPDQAATLLETLADIDAIAAPGGAIAAPVRATMFDQASQAWLLAGDAKAAYQAASRALALAPDNPDLWVDRAGASMARQRFQAAIDDFTQAYARDTRRNDILVQRAGAARMLGHIDVALDDIERVLTADPDNAEALLERGILRQRRNDIAGARGDWNRVVAVAADSQTADLALQDLALLDAGPVR